MVTTSTSFDASHLLAKRDTMIPTIPCMFPWPIFTCFNFVFCWPITTLRFPYSCFFAYIKNDNSKIQVLLFTFLFKIVYIACLFLYLIFTNVSFPFYSSNLRTFDLLHSTLTWKRYQLRNCNYQLVDDDQYIFLWGFSLDTRLEMVIVLKYALIDLSVTPVSFIWCNKECEGKDFIKSSSCW